MKPFLINLSIFSIIIFTSAELISRIFIDPFYFYNTDTYNVKLDEPNSLLDIYNSKKTEHVDYLFIGSSKIPATINPALIMSKNSTVKVIAAGRGNMTPGIHFQALENRISKFPDYLKGASVFIEYAGSNVYSNYFSEDKLKVYEPILPSDKAMPHLILPHLTFRSLIAFMNESRNTNSVKVDVALQFFISSYRTWPFVKEKVKNIFKNEQIKQRVVSEGGIRNDNYDFLNKIAIDFAEIQRKKVEDSPMLSFQQLDKSSLAYLNNLIKINGGKLFLFKMPISSIEDVYQSKKALENKKTFEEWISLNGIEVISNDSFQYQDSDFPDTWHLSIDRRDEFTSLLFNEMQKAKIYH